jgi:hypothetical protein
VQSTQSSPNAIQGDGNWGPAVPHAYIEEIPVDEDKDVEGDVDVEEEGEEEEKSIYDEDEEMSCVSDEEDEEVEGTLVDEDEEVEEVEEDDLVSSTVTVTNGFPAQDYSAATFPAQTVPAGIHPQPQPHQQGTLSASALLCQPISDAVRAQFAGIGTDGTAAAAAVVPNVNASQFQHQQQHEQTLMHVHLPHLAYSHPTLATHRHLPNPNPLHHLHHSNLAQYHHHQVPQAPLVEPVHRI